MVYRMAPFSLTLTPNPRVRVMVRVRVGKVRKPYPNFQMVPLSMTFSDLWPTFQGKDHRLRGSASTVLTANGQVNGRWRILTPHRIETHEPTATKFRTIDYVCGRAPWTKFGTNPSTGGFWAYGWNITFLCLFCLFIYLFIHLYLFFWDSRTGQTGWWIFTCDSSLDVKSRKDVPFWGYKT